MPAGPARRRLRVLRGLPPAQRVRAARCLLLPRHRPLRRWLPGGLVFVGPNRAGWGGRGVYVRGVDLEPELALLPTLLRPGDTVVDVGASTGVYTLLAARRVGAAGLVVSLEPNPAMGAALRANVARNHLHHVRVRQLAASDAEGVVTLAGRPGRPNTFGIVPQGAAVPGAITATAVRLDRLLADEAVSRVDFVKVDVEGAEDRVLAGAAATLARWRPVLCCEVTRGGLGTPPPGYTVLVAPAPGPNRLLVPEGDRRAGVLRDAGWRPAGT